MYVNFSDGIPEASGRREGGVWPPPHVRAAVLVCAVLLAAASLTGAFYVRAQKQDGGTVVSSAIPTAATGYIVREYIGRVAVFAESSDTPLQVIDVYTDTLPVAMRSQLKDGIRVKTHDELLSLLENITS